MNTPPTPPVPHDDSDMDGIQLTREETPARSVEDMLSPEIAVEIEVQEARLRELLARKGSEDETDEPVGALDAAEIERVSRRINQLRHQQREHLDAVADDETATG